VPISPLFALLILVTADPAPGYADSVACPGTDMVVTAVEKVDAELACAGARDAADFLGGLGLRVPQALRVELVDDLPQLYGAEQLGSFDASTGRIQVLSYARCDQIGHDALLFEQPLGPALYRSLVAHEVAHAVSAVNYSGAGSHVVAQEYIAYATQFTAMSAELRSRILDASAISAFADETEMGLTRYLFSPQAFGIAAYRHFTGHRGGRDFVWRLLRGEVRTGSPYAY